MCFGLLYRALLRTNSTCFGCVAMEKNQPVSQSSINQINHTHTHTVCQQEEVRSHVQKDGRRSSRAFCIEEEEVRGMPGQRRWFRTREQLFLFLFPPLCRLPLVASLPVPVQESKSGAAGSRCRPEDLFYSCPRRGSLCSARAQTAAAKFNSTAG